MIIVNLLPVSANNFTFLHLDDLYLGVLEPTFLTCLSLAEAAVPGQYLVPTTILTPAVLDLLSLEELVSLTFSNFLVLLLLPG